MRSFTELNAPAGFVMEHCVPGAMENPRVVDDKYSYRALTLFTLRAIKDADIPRMPLDVIPSLPMNDPERFKIEYNALIY